jgi:hypothetical protein
MINYLINSAQNHAKETSYGNNLGYHAYMFNTPKDFKYLLQLFLFIYADQIR